MLPIHTILPPTDFSEHSEHAFRLACGLARDYSARLIVLHVWSMPPPVFGEVVPVPPPTADAYLAETEQKLHQLQPTGPDVDVEHRLQEGDPVSMILRVATEAHVDLIILGTHGRTGLSRLLRGSLAEQILRRAPCPVVAVKNPFLEVEPVPSAAGRALMPEAMRG